MINQRIAVGAASQAIGIDGTHHLRIHIDGQRSGIGMAILVVKGVGKCLFGDDGGERDIAVEGIGVMTINANGQFAVQPVNDGAGRATQRIKRDGTAARAVHRQQGMHAGNMVSVINIAGDTVRCGSLEVLQVDYRTFHAGGDGDIPQAQPPDASGIVEAIVAGVQYDPAQGYIDIATNQQSAIERVTGNLDVVAVIQRPGDGQPAQRQT